MMRRLWTGCGTALVTPFAADGSVDEKGVRRLARRQIDAGVHFLVPCGTTGESPTLSEEERVRVVELVVEEAAGTVPVLAGAGGYDTREVIMTITVREKGKALEDGGGIVLTADSWLGPQVAALKEVSDFDVKYWKQLQGPDAMGMSAEQLATVMAMYPAVRQAMERLQKEGTKLQGTPLATTTTVEGVKSKEAAQQADSGRPTGGLGGMLARKMAKKDNDPASGRAMASRFWQVPLLRAAAQPRWVWLIVTKPAPQSPHLVKPESK